MEQLKVKAGDKVIYNYRGQEHIVTVTKVTPTGRIRIDFNDRQFNKYGSPIGCRDHYFQPHIYEATPEGIKRIEQKEAILKAYNMCHNVYLEDLNYDMALKIIEILGDEADEL